MKLGTKYVSGKVYIGERVNIYAEKKEINLRHAAGTLAATTNAMGES